MRNYLQKFTMSELNVVVTILLSVVILLLLLSNRAQGRGVTQGDTVIKSQSNLKPVTAEEYTHRKLRYERSKKMLDIVRINPDGTMVEVDPDQRYPEVDLNVPPHLRPQIQEPLVHISPEIYNERKARYERAKDRYERVIVGDDGKYYEHFYPNDDEDDLENDQLQVGYDMTICDKSNQENDQLQVGYDMTICDNSNQVDNTTTASTLRPPMLRVTVEEYAKRQLEYEDTKSKLNYIRILGDGSIGRVDPNQKYPEVDLSVPPHLRPQIQEPIIPVSTQEHKEMIRAAEEAKQRYERVVVGADGNYYEDMNPKVDKSELEGTDCDIVNGANLGQTGNTTTASTLRPPMLRVTAEEYAKRKLEYEDTKSKLNYIRILGDGSIGRVDPNQKYPEINPNVPPHLRPQIQEPLLPVSTQEHKEMIRAAKEARERYERVVVGNDGNYYEPSNLTEDALSKGEKDVMGSTVKSTNEVKADKLKDKSKPKEIKKKMSR